MYLGTVKNEVDFVGSEIQRIFPNTILLKNYPPILSGPEAVFNVTIGGIQLPQYSHLPQFYKVGQGNFHLYIHPENSEVLIDQFSGQTEPFVVVGQFFAGQSSCRGSRSTGITPHWT